MRPVVIVVVVVVARVPCAISKEDGTRKRTSRSPHDRERRYGSKKDGARETGSSSLFGETLKLCKPNKPESNNDMARGIAYVNLREG